MTYRKAQFDALVAPGAASSRRFIWIPDHLTDDAWLTAANAALLADEDPEKAMCGLGILFEDPEGVEA